MSGIFRDIRRFGSNNNISQKVLTSTIFLFFSGTLIFLDTGGSFMYGVPIELILPIYIIQLALIPAYLKRYEYEYFMVNVGTAPYKGTGSSIKKTSSDTGSSGTAYKLYACGIFYGQGAGEDNHNGVVQIIIPLESLIVMPN